MVGITIRSYLSSSSTTLAHLCNAYNAVRELILSSVRQKLCFFATLLMGETLISQRKKGEQLRSLVLDATTRFYDNKPYIFCEVNSSVAVDGLLVGEGRGSRTS